MLVLLFMNARLNSAETLEMMHKNANLNHSAPLLFFSFSQYFRIYWLCRNTALDFCLQIKLIFITRKFKLKMLWTVNTDDVVMMEHHSSTVPAKVLKLFID